jgi:uncharacterized membrane protein YgcG
VNVQHFIAKILDSSDEDDPDAPLDLSPVAPLAHLEILQLTSTPNSRGYLRILDFLTLPALLLLRIAEVEFMEGAVVSVKNVIARSASHVLQIVVLEAEVYTTRYYRRAWPSVAEVLVKRIASTDTDGSNSDEEEETEDEGSGSDELDNDGESSGTGGGSG